ncbi:multicopper oxidase domain-containing protein, partial [Acinetobacter baumannii]
MRLKAAPTPVTVAGREARLWTYGGSFPGPTLRVRPGDTVRLELENLLPESTNLHWHGLPIPP